MRTCSPRIPGAELIVQPHAGHLWPLEQPDAAAALIGEFLDRPPAPPA